MAEFKKEAFSLIEVMAVIVTISVLLAAFMPIISNKLQINPNAIHSISLGITKNCTEKFNAFCSWCTNSDKNPQEDICLVCNRTCAEGIYLDYDRCVCINCAEAIPDCSKCIYVNQAEKCTECTSPKFLYNNTCVDTCPAGYIANEANVCITEHCKTINANYVCAECNDGYYLDSNNTCVSCVEGCKKCSDGSICDDNGCEDGYYKNTFSTCSVCMAHCKRCENGAVCQECDTPNYIANSDNTECLQNCPSHCLICSDLNTCTQCDTVNGYSLNSTTHKCDYTRKYIKLPYAGVYMTQYNIGDNGIPIASPGVTIKDASDSCNSATANCCWQGTTANSLLCTNGINGNYSGCTRTVCNWSAANISCEALSINGITNWHIPTVKQLRSIGNSINFSSNYQKENGLMICSASDANSRADNCETIWGNGCYGTTGNNCAPLVIWSSEKYYLSAGGVASYFTGRLYTNATTFVIRADHYIAANIFTTGYSGMTGPYWRNGYSTRCVAPICANGQQYITASNSCVANTIANGYYDGSAFYRCNDGYYDNGSGCSKCITGCATCYADKLCTSCDSGYRISKNNNSITCVSN